MFLLVFKSFLLLSNPSNLSDWIITSLKETNYAWLISALLDASLAPRK